MNSVNSYIPPFIPFDKIMVCGNIISAKYLFCIGNYYPIIIGKSSDNKPEVYCYARTKQGIERIVNKNESTHPQVECNNSETMLKFNIKNKDGKETVTFFELLISDKYIPEITKLDLRPLGLNIWGGNNGLIVGNSFYKDNIIECSETFYSTK